MSCCHVKSQFILTLFYQVLRPSAARPPSAPPRAKRRWDQHCGMLQQAPHALPLFAVAFFRAPSPGFLSPLPITHSQPLDVSSSRSRRPCSLEPGRRRRFHRCTLDLATKAVAARFAEEGRGRERKRKASSASRRSARRRGRRGDSRCATAEHRRQCSVSSVESICR